MQTKTRTPIWSETSDKLEKVNTVHIEELLVWYVVFIASELT